MSEKFAIAIRGPRRGSGEGFVVISGLKSKDHAAVVGQLGDQHRTFKATQSFEYGELLVFEDLGVAEFAKANGIKVADIDKAVKARVDERAEAEAARTAEAKRKRQEREEQERLRIIAERTQELKDNAVAAEEAAFRAKAAELVDAEMVSTS